MNDKISKFDENYKLTDPNHSRFLKHIGHEKQKQKQNTTLWHMKITDKRKKVLKTNRKRQIPSSRREARMTMGFSLATM